MQNKYLSRKFLVACAAFLGSVASSIAGYAIDNEYVIIFGMVCGTLSAAIYAFSEAYVDAASVSANSNTTTTTVSASSASKELVQTLLAPKDANGTPSA